MASWLILSLLTGLTVAMRDVSVKIFRDLAPPAVAAVELFWALPFLLTGLALVPIPTLDPEFWQAFLWSLPLNGAAYLLYLYAIKLSPISLSVPFLAFTPVFMLFTGFVTLGETANGWGLAGVLLIVAGSYLLNLPRVREGGLLAPFRALGREKGSWMMLIVSFLYAFAAVVGKKAILHSSPLFFAFFFFSCFNLLMVGLLWATGRTSWPQLRRHRRKGLWLASLLTVQVGLHSLAVVLAAAVYMIAVKRSSILFSVLLSWLLLGEQEIAARGAGALCMFAGVLLITLLG